MLACTLMLFSGSSLFPVTVCSCFASSDASLFACTTRLQTRIELRLRGLQLIQRFKVNHDEIITLESSSHSNHHHTRIIIPLDIPRAYQSNCIHHRNRTRFSLALSCLVSLSRASKFSQDRIHVIKVTCHTRHGCLIQFLDRVTAMLSCAPLSISRCHSGS